MPLAAASLCSSSKSFLTSPRIYLSVRRLYRAPFHPVPNFPSLTALTPSPSASSPPSSARCSGVPHLQVRRGHAACGGGPVEGAVDTCFPLPSAPLLFCPFLSLPASCPANAPCPYFPPNVQIFNEPADHRKTHLEEVGGGPLYQSRNFTTICVQTPLSPHGRQMLLVPFNPTITTPDLPNSTSSPLSPSLPIHP